MGKPVRFICTDKNGAVIHDRVLDHNEYESRVWCAKTIYWGVRSGHRIEILSNIEDIAS